MSEELIPPFTGPMSTQTAQYRAKQAVEYYHRQVKSTNNDSNSSASNISELPKRNNRDRQDARDTSDRVNGYRSGQYTASKNVNVENSSQGSQQSYPYDPPPDRFTRGGHRATVHGTNSGHQWQQNNMNNASQHQNNRRPPPEHRTGSKKRYSRGLHRSNSNLEESMEYINLETLDNSMSRREYGSTSSLDMMNASTSSDSFFQMLENLRPSVVDQRSPAPSKLKEVLRGSTTEDRQQFLRNLEKIANGSVIHNRPSSDEVDAGDGGQSPRTRKKDRKLRSKSITPDVGPGVWKRFRGKNEQESSAKAADTVSDLEVKGDDRFRRKAFVHYDSQSIGFDVARVLHRKTSVTAFSNISTGASAASGTRESFAGDAEAPDIGANTDDGDGQSNDLVQSCPFFRNEIGGEEEWIVGLTQSIGKAKHTQTNKDRSPNRSAIVLNRSPECCGVTVLDCSPTSTGHIIPPHIKHRGHVIEYVDSGANYYRHFFNGQEHQNYFGIDDALGPVALSVKREKLEERENNLGKSEPNLYQYRIILRSGELCTLRGCVLEDAIPASGRLSSSRGIPIKDLLEFLVPDLQASCLRQATVGQKTNDQLMKLDEQRIFNTYKIGIMYCRAGQTTEEEMYNNEFAGPAFEEFLQCIGDKVRLKGFEKYRAQLDNKTDSTGTHSIYTTFNNAEIMFHVSTMLPYTPKNQQQLLRKRHIGNDIVTIVFQESGAPPFTPKSVRSQFQHVFIVVRVHNPCSEKTSYSISVTRSKDVPPFGPPIPENAKLRKSREFADFLLAKVVNAENAAHHSEKFSAMAVRTRQEYLKDLATNYVTSNSLESASKLSKFALSGKKKEKNRGKMVPDMFAQGAVVWSVQVEDSGDVSPLPCYLGISAETVVIVEESSRHVIFTTHCGSIIGWTSQALVLKLYYQQGGCVVLQPSSGDMEELQEIVTRLRSVTPGCETQELTLKRNGLGQLGFHIQAEGIVTDVEHYGFAHETGLRKGSRLVEICKVATITLTHDQMVDLLRTSATVKVVVISPLKDGTPRGVVNLHANHHYSSFPALNAVIQAEYSHAQRQARTSSSSSESVLSPVSPVTKEPSLFREKDHLELRDGRDQRDSRDSREIRDSKDLRDQLPQGPSSRSSQHSTGRESQRAFSERTDSLKSDMSQTHRHSREYSSSTRESTPREFEESWELREIIRSHSRADSTAEGHSTRSLRDSVDQDESVFVSHEREVSITSSQSYTSQRSGSSSNTLPHQKKSSTSSDHRGEMRSPPSRSFYLTDSAPWATSSLPRGATAHGPGATLPAFHGYQDSLASSGRGSLFDGPAGGTGDRDQFGSSSRGLDDSSYGTLEERHTNKRSGSKDSLLDQNYGGSRDWTDTTQPSRPPLPKETRWQEATSTSRSTYLTNLTSGSTENVYASSSGNALHQSASAPAPLSQQLQAAPLPGRKPQPPPPGIDYSSVQHGNYAQELLKQSQNTKYLLNQGGESSRDKGLNSANSSSVNLSDTSFSSGGSGQAGNMPQPGPHTRDRSRDDSQGRRRANTGTGPQHSKSVTSGVARMAELSSVSPLSSEQSSPRSSHKNLSGMSSEESLSTRLRPGVTTKLSKARATNNLQDDLMRLIDPDIDDNDLAGLLTSRSSSRRLSGRLVRTMSDESLHSGKGGHLHDTDIREALFPERRPELHGSREQLRQHRLSPRVHGDQSSRVPMPDSAASLDWTSLVDVATKAIEGGPDTSKDRISSPLNTTTSSTASSTNTNKSSTSKREVKVESLYRQKHHDRPPDPPTASNPPVWRSVVANPQQRIQELEVKVSQLEEELAQERQESAALDGEVQRLRTENARLQEESQNAAAQLRRFTEWFFTTIDRQ